MPGGAPEKGVGARAITAKSVEIEKYKDVIPETIPSFPGGKWEVAINDGWYRAVAPNVDPAS